MKHLIAIFYCSGIFLAGHVAALNLATMYPNENYAAGWGRVAIACFFGIFFTAGALSKPK